MTTSKREQAFQILDETDGDISNPDLAERVGYSSRSSAYKARQKWLETRETSGTDSTDSTDLNDNGNDNGQEQETESPDLGNTSTDEQDNGRSDEGNGTGTSSGIFGNETTGGNESDGGGSSERTHETDNSNSSRTGSEQQVNVGNTNEGKSAKPTDEDQTSIDPPDGVPEAGASEWEPFSDDQPDLDEEGGEVEGNKDWDEVKSTDEIVGEADDPEEQARREEMLGQLEQNTVESPHGTGLDVDEDLMARLFQMPFSAAANITEYDGWEVTDEEAQVNAELLIAYCEENNIEVSTGTMLAMSLSQTVGTRAVGYMRHKKSEEQDENGGVQPRQTEENPPEEQEEQEDEQEQDEPNPEVSGGFDPTDPTTW